MEHVPIYSYYYGEKKRKAAKAPGYHRVTEEQLKLVSDRLVDRGYWFDGIEDVRHIEHEFLCLVEIASVHQMHYQVWCSRVGVTPFIRIVKIKKQYFILKTEFEGI
jgi:hypothetical protein